MSSQLLITTQTMALTTWFLKTFAQKPSESLVDFFARFEFIVSSLRSCDPFAYSNNERAKQLLYALDDHV
jgi:hypothetical protein